MSGHDGHAHDHGGGSQGMLRSSTKAIHDRWLRWPEGFPCTYFSTRETID